MVDLRFTFVYGGLTCRRLCRALPELFVRCLGCQALRRRLASRHLHAPVEAYGRVSRPPPTLPSPDPSTGGLGTCSQEVLGCLGQPADARAAPAASRGRARRRPVRRSRVSQSRDGESPRAPRPVPPGGRGAERPEQHPCLVHRSPPAAAAPGADPLPGLGAGPSDVGAWRLERAGTVSDLSRRRPDGRNRGAVEGHASTLIGVERARMCWRRRQGQRSAGLSAGPCAL